jgi:hypothetical protein
VWRSQEAGVDPFNRPHERKRAIYERMVANKANISICTQDGERARERGRGSMLFSLAVRCLQAPGSWQSWFMMAASWTFWHPRGMSGWSLQADRCFAEPAVC